MPATTEKKPARKKLPKELAVIFADNCTGCEACVAMCPVDCIRTITVGHGVKGVESWCEVDLDRCIGCRLCVRLPRRDKSDTYQMLVCPWEAIEMTPVAQIGDAIRQVGGRPDYVSENQKRLEEMAQRQTELAEKKKGA